jgi:hypothetical protein
MSDRLARRLRVPADFHQQHALPRTCFRIFTLAVECPQTTVACRALPAEPAGRAAPFRAASLHLFQALTPLLLHAGGTSMKVGTLSISGTTAPKWLTKLISAN